MLGCLKLFEALSHVLKIFLSPGFSLVDGSDSKEATCNARDWGLIPESGRFPGEGNGYPLQCSCLENSMDGGTWWATVPEVRESDKSEWLTPSLFHFQIALLLLNCSQVY